MTLGSAFGAPAAGTCALGDGDGGAGALTAGGGLVRGAGGAGGASWCVKKRGMTTRPASAARLIHADRLLNVLSVDTMLACFPFNSEGPICVPVTKDHRERARQNWDYAIARPMS
jgi:hypothetical protein